MELFVAKVEKLQASAYMKHVLERRGTQFTFDWSADTKVAKFESNVPEAEARDALLLTARMLVQERDKVSFRRMAELEA